MNVPNPFIYQLTKDEFIKQFSISNSTLQRIRYFAKKHYLEWYKVFLLKSNRIDLREYQKLLTFISEWEWERMKDPKLRYRDRK